MTDEALQLREQILFRTAPRRFAPACEQVVAGLLAEARTASASRCQQIAETTAELAIDLQSYLPRWRLQNPECPPQVSAAVLQTAVDRLCGLLLELGASESLARVRTEVAAIQRSNFARLSRLTDRGELAMRWGYDYASGIACAVRRGAILVTTNPPLVNLARKEDPAKWGAVRRELRAADPGATAGRLTSRFTMHVVLENCRILRPIFEATHGRLGYVNFQVNPANASDSGRMAEEIESIYAAMGDELGGRPNVVFKVPGTKAALATVRRVTAKGIGVTITLSFSVDQHLAFAEAIEAGSAAVSFLVMMNGRLDDPVRDELLHNGVADGAEVAKWASTAIVRRSYRLLFAEAGYHRSALLVASLRGPWNVDGAICAGPHPLFVTSFPDKTAEYDSLERRLGPSIEEPVPAAMLSALRRSRMFQQAYEVGGLTPAGFDTFYPVVVTHDAFAKAYAEVGEWLLADPE